MSGIDLPPKTGPGVKLDMDWMEGGEMPRKQHTPDLVMKELQALTEQYKQTYSRIRPHSSLDYRPPAPQTVMTVEPVPELVGLT